MSFFPLYSSDRSFTPLFRLLDDFDKYSRETQGSQAHRQQHVRTFNPKFDVRETEATYELHGELPGVNRDNVQIEFTEPQTLVVRGRVERTYTAGTPSADLVEDSAPKAALPAADYSAGTKVSSHHATVEDETETEADGQATPVETPEPQAAKSVQREERPKTPAEKYWFSERSVGEFSRTFNFPTRVSQDDVTANLNNGILTVTIPKAKKHESRRITVN